VADRRRRGPGRPFAAVEEAGTREAVARLVRSAPARLRPREALVVSLRYGLDGREHTLRELGPTLGVTHEWARQVALRALAAMGKSREIRRASAELEAARG
jgi:DNA-directed RNA polymerase sigma subunit (sigma70/sigma32)